MAQWGTPEGIEAAKNYVHCEVGEKTGVAYLTLNRPDKHNALSVPMRDMMTDYMHRLDSDRRVRVVVIRGAGPSFCSGNEINEDWGQRGQEYRRFTVTHAYRYSSDMSWGRAGFSQAISRSSKVTIAQIHGYCAAAAYFLIAAKCDIVAAASDAKLGALEARFLGPASAVASLHLNRILGTKAARLLGYTGQAMSGADAQRYGLASVVVLPDELDSCVEEMAARIGSQPAERLLYLKARIRLAESNLDTNVPVISGLLASHFLRAAPDEHRFWDSVRREGVKGALDTDKQHAAGTTNGVRE